MDADPSFAGRRDWTVPATVALLACGWFFMSSLSTDLGAAQPRFHFYNVLTLMRAPGEWRAGRSVTQRRDKPGYLAW
jgi:hypothetical protein